MSKVTSKLQVTLPKAIAQAHGIRPGDEIEWDLLRKGLANDTPRLPHQAILEFVAAVSRPLSGGARVVNPFV